MRTAAILAGGRARRFGGRPKALLSVGNRRLIDLQIAALRAVAGRVAIVTTDEQRYSSLGLPVWADLVPDAGPLGGIYTALARSSTARTVVVAGDMPFLTARFLRYLVGVGRHMDVVVPRPVDGRQPLCACYARRCIPVIKRHLEEGMYKVTDLLDALRVREIGPVELEAFDPDGRLFFNINTPDDYTRGLSLYHAEHE